MTDRIDLVGIEVFARHGVFDFEQEKAQMFRVDVSMELDLEPAGVSDQLEMTVDYGQISEQVREVVGSESHQLIETVAQRVATTVLQHPLVDRVRVTIHKPEAPVAVALADVSVTVERSR